MMKAKKMIGESPVIKQVHYLIQRVAKSDFGCLLLGETGTGKELAARAIHDNSPRKEKPFIVVNCSALSETLLESELFGHVKGAFTGAIRDKAGKFELANGGTLFLDEIGELPPHIQVKLLRFLQEKEIERVGDIQVRKLNVRIISATNRDLRELVAQGKFREDLYYRLKVFTITLPPLRVRKGDISLLVTHFLGQFDSQIEVSSQAMEVLQKYSWPGNIRELENAVQYALVLHKDSVIEKNDLPQDIFSSPKHFSPPKEDVSKKEALIAALNAADGNRTQAAKILGVSRVTVWQRMKKYGLINDEEADDHLAKVVKIDHHTGSSNREYPRGVS